MSGIPEILMGEWYGGLRDDGSVLCVFNFRAFMGQITLQKLNPETHRHLDAESLGYYADFINERKFFEQSLTIKQAQAAALAWARQVLGKALVDAGADVETIGVCEKCGAKGPGRHCLWCSSDGRMDTMKPVKYARIEGA